MNVRRYVDLDPDGGQGDCWLYGIVQAPTGVFYGQQYGGTACKYAYVEGYLVPVQGDEALSELRAIFEGVLHGSGTTAPHEFRWPPELLQRLESAVGGVVMWSSARSMEGRLFSGPESLVLDRSRLSEADEAWIPVITPDGPGMLVWCNSD